MERGEDRVDWSIKVPNFATEFKIKPIWLESKISLIDIYRSCKRIVRLFFLIFNRRGGRITRLTF